MAPSLPSVPQVLGVVIYTDSTELESLSPSPIPCLQHVAGKVTDSAKQQSDHVTVYEYPNSASSAFALPFQPDFSYNTEAVSHTRNLTFLKRQMNGPYFDLERIWEEHTYFEFENRSVEYTMSTMVQEPYVNHITTVSFSSACRSFDRLCEFSDLSCLDDRRNWSGELDRFLSTPLYFQEPSQ